MGQAWRSSMIDFLMILQLQVFLVQLSICNLVQKPHPGARLRGCSRGMMAAVTAGLRRMTNTQRIVSNLLLRDESVHFDLERVQCSRQLLETLFVPNESERICGEERRTCEEYLLCSM